MKLSTALFFAACLIAGTAQAQNPHVPSASPPCPTAADTTPADLYGLWRAEFAKLPQFATLLLEKHPELSDSLGGAISRDGVQARIVGDIEQGEFSLEESQDGLQISAGWLGTVLATSCGKEIRGTWTDTTTRNAYPFVLRKLPDPR